MNRVLCNNFFLLVLLLWFYVDCAPYVQVQRKKSIIKQIKITKKGEKRNISIRETYLL